IAQVDCRTTGRSRRLHDVPRARDVHPIANFRHVARPRGFPAWHTGSKDSIRRTLFAGSVALLRPIARSRGAAALLARCLQSILGTRRCGTGAALGKITLPVSRAAVRSRWQEAVRWTRSCRAGAGLFDVTGAHGLPADGPGRSKGVRGALTARTRTPLG